ncbi:hypothetical protein P691DRAFT_783153 [Macrolepiota fuliginosa MF-IS2]|uniref:Uncharacterized protein n=1 Tax=Macrolepiota fuliginosa MF-IS2 TaxID=1400762 RepID=A0A9P5XBB3_9AGAR|nr:hypothetical protein P691DRAFT_783153 [Macrolepiota fuliginosa MF-IS2]
MFPTITILETFKSAAYALRTLQKVKGGDLPTLWQEVEVGVGKHNKMSNRVAKELVRQLEIVTVRVSSLASYVCEASVFLGSYSADTIFPELTRALQLFPRMRSLRILADIVVGRPSRPNVELLVLKGPI